MNTNGPREPFSDHNEPNRQSTPNLATPTVSRTATATPIPAGRILNMSSPIPTAGKTKTCTKSRSSTSKSQTTATGTGNTRYHLSDDDLIFMFKLCCEHGDRYLKAKNKEDFWVYIQTLLSNKIGVHIGIPRQKAQSLVREFRIKQEIEKTKSGISIPDGELNQAISNWVTDWLDREESEKKTVDKSQEEEKAQHTAAVKKHQKSLLKSFKHKADHQAAKVAVSKTARLRRKTPKENEDGSVADDSDVTIELENGTQKRHASAEPTERPLTKKQKDQEIIDKRRDIRAREELYDNAFADNSKNSTGSEYKR
ncbi:hypothetical protein BJ508DRAFT_326820 [Ascobolus immersus RN42]|uniref:Uncharacterized protein n=1 Tax=Ascobolus immersus RN42 TaxID=1160509 RepID=A0A3N4I9V6_ASCIM|nr:hypothetical protein BJ508DRAFT_326820 [Ascobolus immersus RN42]